MYDVLIIGAGHNGLVAACYLALANKKVLILESSSEIGGATLSARAFEGMEANISRYSYLVSLLPDRILEDLSISFETRSRRISSYTPTYFDGEDTGLLVERLLGDESERSFHGLVEDHSELEQWEKFYGDIHKLAKVLAPTLLQPLLTRGEMRELAVSAGHEEIWKAIIETPIGATIRERFKSDLVRGVVLTDALIGTFAPADSSVANKCFLYHLIGNGSGEWKVPLGGMGELINKLSARALALGVEIRTNSKVTRVKANEDCVSVAVSGGAEIQCNYLAANCAPQVLAEIMGTPSANSLPGSQLKINMLLKKLPRLKSGIDPLKAFGGTFHIDEGYIQLEQAYSQALTGNIPDVIPAEMYCHTISDPSILSAELKAKGYQTLTLFALHLPYALFLENNEKTKTLVLSRLFAQLNAYLIDPIEDCLAMDANGQGCVEVNSPVDLEATLAMPLGNIFHTGLDFPFKDSESDQRWGSETVYKRVFICGAGSLRGGGVSGIGGHNAAMAILECIQSPTWV